MSDLRPEYEGWLWDDKLAAIREQTLAERGSEMSANEHDDDQPDSFEVIERLRSQLAAKDAEIARLRDALMMARPWIVDIQAASEESSIERAETLRMIGAALKRKGEAK